MPNARWQQLDIEPDKNVPVGMYHRPSWMIVHGDCMKVMPSFNDNDFHVTLTDIPYNEVNKRRSHKRSIRRIKKAQASDVLAFDCMEFVNEVCRLTSGHVFIFCGYEQLSPIVARMRERWDMHVRVGRWRKTNPSPMNGHSRYLSDVELCAVGAKKGAPWFGRYERPEWEYRVPTSAEKQRHDAFKPTPLWQKMLAPVVKPGMRVLDPCAGSMSSAEASLLAEVDWVGIESDEEVIARNKPFVEKVAESLHLT